MRRKFMYVLASAILAWAVQIQAQTASAAATSQAAPQEEPMLAPGTVVGAELSKGIDAKKAKVGQEVVAKSLIDLRDPNGNIVIPRGAKLVGHVTQVKAASKQDPQSSLGLLFDKAQPKHGQEVGMHAAIQALTGPPPSPVTPAESGPPSASAGGPMGGAQPGTSPGGRSGGGIPSGASDGQGPYGNMGGGNMGAPESGAGSAPALNANSHGVIGLPNLTLSPQPSPTEGSVISSSHGNVRLDGGTMMVLRVIGQ
jgi:hypothetical protein